MALIPDSVEVIGEELAIRWPDGREAFHRLEDLRRSCPCALCRGEQGITGPLLAPAPPPSSPNAWRLVSFELVGAYGLRLFWGDGHSSGIYPLATLRQQPGSAPAPA